MSAQDLPVTVDEKPSPISTHEAVQNTTAPQTEVSSEATTGLDLRGYELVERLGGGGMGDVYRAVDPALGRDLAVKVMKAELQGHGAAEQRFLREARVTGSLQHPGIVPIYNLGRLTDGRLHYTMRLVRGRTLADILNRESGQPEHFPSLISIFEKVCQAVAYAHSKGVLHRDLKPANIMVGRFGEVQVMDWGLAKLLTARDDPLASETAADTVGTRIHTESEDTPPELTCQGREMGTPGYMPPEQALGEWDTVDERADVFALGAILCEILTGRPPYHGSGGKEALRKAKRGDCAEALGQLDRCGADAALPELCRECLAVREARPRDAEQVAQRMGAYRVEVQERLRRAELESTAALVQARWERKRRRWIWAAMLFLLIGLAGSTWQAVRATKAEGRAQEKESLARESEGRALKAAEAESAAKREVEQSVQAERQAKTLAQTRLGQIEKAIDVLTGVFRDLDPRMEEKGGPNLRLQLSQRLDRAASQLDERAFGDPVAVARLQAELGTSLMSLGQDRLAVKVLGKAVATLEAKLGFDHPDTLACRNELAIAYQSAGRIADAIRLNEQTLKRREAKLGLDHPDTLNSRNSLATALHFAGRTAEAIPLFEQTLKQREAKLGINHPATLASRNNLAVAYRSADRFVEAIPLLEQTLKERESRLGPDHPDTLQSRNNLATTFRSAGRMEEAVRLLEQTLKQRANKLGPVHPHTLMSMANLGAAYRDTGRLAEAVPLLETALQRGRARPGGLPTLLAWLPGILADTYESTGSLTKAETIYRDFLEQTQRQHGADDSRTADALGRLGANLVKQKKFADAETQLRRCLSIREKKQPDAWNTFNTRSVLGEALLGRRKYTAAEPLLLQGYEGMKKRQDQIPPAFRQLRLNEALQRLVRLYEAVDQKDRAAEYRKKLVESKAAQTKTKSQ